MCRQGACTSGGNCGDFCNSNADCYATWCNTCMNNTCRVTCGERCVQHSDCGAPCNQCMQGKCQIAGCGSACTDYRDCITSDCKQCFQGVCKPGGCGSPCLQGMDCYGQGNCTTCSNPPFGGGPGMCTSRCGSPCASHEQCFGQYTNCGECSGGACAPVSTCGLGCVDNTGCSRSSTCKRCNKNLRLCDRGGQCGEACATNADCDPSSSCPGCKHGTCQP